jgi:hypothetical protein
MQSIRAVVQSRFQDVEKSKCMKIYESMDIYKYKMNIQRTHSPQGICLLDPYGVIFNITKGHYNSDFSLKSIP